MNGETMKIGLTTMNNADKVIDTTKSENMGMGVEDPNKKVPEAVYYNQV